MTNTEWLLEKCPSPMDSADLINLYDELCEYQGSHMSSESFKRLCRKTAQEYRDNAEISTETDNLKDTEVLLDKLNETDNKLELSLKSYKIQDVEAAAKIAGIDLSKWRCIRKKVKATQNASNPYFIVEGSFAPKEEDEITPEKYAERFKDLVEDYEPPVPPLLKTKIDPKNRMAEICIMDFHYGQLSWDEETRDDNYNIEIASKLLDGTIDHFIQETEGKIDRYVLPIGNDFFNCNTKANTTFGGTPQDEDGHFKHTHLTAEALWVKQIDKLNTVADVEVVLISGNHDEERLWYLGQFLFAWYRNNSSVIIDNSPPQRKYIRYGRNLLGFTHGNKEIRNSLPLLMAQEMPIDFSETKFREWNIGHLHSYSEKNTRLVKETHGIREIVLPSLVPLDSWHSGKGYMHLNEAMCFIWDKEKGKVMTHYFHP